MHPHQRALLAAAHLPPCPSPSLPLERRSRIMACRTAHGVRRPWGGSGALAPAGLTAAGAGAEAACREERCAAGGQQGRGHLLLLLLLLLVLLLVLVLVLLLLLLLLLLGLPA